MDSHLIEANFDGLVGPTHHFGGLGVGNLASQSHGGHVARPRAAAIQGIEKMRLVASLGVAQAILPPQQRPDLRMLQRLGLDEFGLDKFGVGGNHAQVLRAAYEASPRLLSAAWSASSMWAANAATVSAAPACRDGRTHLTIANLSSSLHRSLEPAQTLKLFRRIFHDDSFVIHPPLPHCVSLRDEGAANHMRLTDHSGKRGIDIFVYGSDSLDGHKSNDSIAPSRFFPRQGLDTSKAIARLHRLDKNSTFFLKQHPAAIDAGAFHNDVVAVSHHNIWLHHQLAYEADAETFERIEQRFTELTGEPLLRYEINSDALPLQDAVNSYLFNGQILSRRDDHSMTIVCPAQVQETPAALAVVKQLIAGEGPITDFRIVDLRESMNNGGGPACLRLRVPMSEAQWQSLPPGVRFTDTLADRLCEIVERHYPETLSLDDLLDADLIDVSRRAVHAIRQAVGFHDAEPRDAGTRDLLR
jgi:succinylarginine dihydrolase